MYIQIGRTYIYTYFRIIIIINSHENPSHNYLIIIIRICEAGDRISLDRWLIDKIQLNR